MYMIIAVAILLIVLMFLALNQAARRILSERAGDAAKVPAEMMPIKAFVDSCVEMVSADALSLLGLQNGIILNDYAEINDYKVNYAYNKKAAILTKKEMEKQLSDYTAKHLPECIDNFKPASPLTRENVDKGILVWFLRLPALTVSSLVLGLSCNHEGHHFL